jgi:hypothetical protein
MTAFTLNGKKPVPSFFLTDQGQYALILWGDNLIALSISRYETLLSYSDARNAVDRASWVVYQRGDDTLTFYRQYNAQFLPVRLNQVREQAETETSQLILFLADKLWHSDTSHRLPIFPVRDHYLTA